MKTDENDDEEIFIDVFNKKFKKDYGDDYLVDSAQACCSECGSVESFETVYIPWARAWESFYIGMYYFSFVLAGLCLLPLPFYFQDDTLFFVGLFFLVLSLYVLFFVINPCVLRQSLMNVVRSVGIIY